MASIRLLKTLCKLRYAYNILQDLYLWQYLFRFLVDLNEPSACVEEGGVEDDWLE